MRTFARANFIALLVILALPTQAQEVSADAVRLNRLMGLGKLWGTVRYLHPYLAYKQIDWDAALVKALPEVREAKTAGEYASAVQKMLNALGDPTTRILQTEMPGAAPDAKLTPFSRKTDRDVLVVTWTQQDSLDFNGTMQKLRALTTELDKVKGMVFDLRAGGDVSFGFQASGLTRLLSATPVTAPGQRSRMYAGYPPQSGFTSGGYYTAFMTQDGERFEPAGKTKEFPVVFVIGEKSVLPPVALALQSAGKGAIVAEGRTTDEAVVVTTFLDLSEGVRAQVRLSELIHEDGTGGFQPDKVVSGSKNGEDPAFKAALAWIGNPKRAKTSSPRLPAQAASAPDKTYADMTYPPLEYRLLAGFRLWTIIRTFFPYKDLMQEDWDGVLREFLPKLEAAKDAQEYALTVAEMVTHVHDSHAFVSSPILQQYFGVAPPPVQARLIEGKPVLTRLQDVPEVKQSRLAIGDVILKVDGEDAQARIARFGKYLAASTPQALANSVMQRLLNGADNSALTLTVQDSSGTEREVKLSRKAAYSAELRKGRTGDILKILPGNIGYADLDRLPVSDVDKMFEMFRETKAILFDMRGYPLGTAWAIAPRLTERQAVPAAKFRRPMVLATDAGGDLSDFNAYTEFTQTIPPTNKARYKGKTVMLIDERTISQAEHSGLFFEAANGTKFVGSPTMGANGDVTRFYVPGGIMIGFTGQAVRHADGRQLQRVGLTPHIEARPTIAGIRAGKDEVLEAALAYLEKE